MPLSNDALFTHGNLMRHVSVMSFTASIGLMAIYAVDLVDIVFISMLGKDALAAAAGYASALMFFTSSINIGLSIAAGALASKAIGAHKESMAREYTTSTAIFVVLTGLALPIIILPNVAFFLSLLGARGHVAQMAASYLWIVIPFTCVSGLSMVAVAVLRARGDGKRAMFPALLGATTNAGLDPVLIFTLGLGLQGAAAATVIARLVTLVVAFYPAIKDYQAFAYPRIELIRRDFLTVSSFAVPAVLASVATPVGTAIVIREMAKFGADAVAAVAIIGRIVPVAFAVVLALSGAIGPIIGQNYGAGLMYRVKEAFIDGLKFVAIYVVTVAGLLFVFRGVLADLFGAADITRSLIFLYCGPLALASFFNGAISVASSAFENLGHPSYSIWMNWGRNTLGTLPFVMVCAAMWGAHGVLVGQALGGAIFALVAVKISFRLIKNPGEKPLSRRFLDHFHMHVMSYHGRG